MQDNTVSRFSMRSYREGDEYAINEMFNEVFNQNRGLSAWCWKYRDNPYGSHYISLAVGPDDVIAAHFAAYPVMLYCSKAEKRGSAEQTIFHAGDKMTRRQFRAAGFGRNALLAKTFEHFKEMFSPGSLFTYGFMTHHSLRFGLLLLNYVMIGQVPYRRLERDIMSGLTISPFKRFITNLSTETVAVIDETWTDFFHRAAPLYQCLIRKDAAYLRWRYLQRPDRDYLIVAVKKRNRLAGWSVFYKEANKIIWGDALFDKADPECVKAVLLHLMTHPASKESDFIECWFPQRPGWWDKILNDIGFKNMEEPNKLHFCIGNFIDNNLPEIIRNNFYYTMGDSDLF